MQIGKSTALWLASLAIVAAVPEASHAWGNDGHRTIGLIAEHFLTPSEKAEVDRLLALPIELDLPATMKDRATWADAFRDSDRNTTKVRYNLTHNWHFVDLELDQPDMSSACFGNKPLPAGTDPSTADAHECVVQKIEEFRRVLADKALPDRERAKALTFLLHFVGDVHQPLHAAQHNNDQGGNLVYIVTGQAKNGSNLHSFWDTATVGRLGSSPESIAAVLVPDISASDIAAWRHGSAREWAMESYKLAHDLAYRTPSKTRSCTIKARDGSSKVETCIVLDNTYRANAAGAAQHQLEAAGVRLAWVISEALK